MSHVGFGVSNRASSELTLDCVMEGRGRGKFCKNREEIGYEEFVCNIE